MSLIVCYGTIGFGLAVHRRVGRSVRWSIISIPGVGFSGRVISVVAVAGMRLGKLRMLCAYLPTFLPNRRRGPSPLVPLSLWCNGVV